MHRILVCLGHEGPIRRICLKYEWMIEYQERVLGSRFITDVEIHRILISLRETVGG